MADDETVAPFQPLRRGIQMLLSAARQRGRAAFKALFNRFIERLGARRDSLDNQIRARNEFLANDLKKLAAINRHLESDQAKLREISERLTNDLATLTMTNQYLTEEREWLISQLGPDWYPTGTGNETTKIKIPDGMLSQFDAYTVVQLAKHVPVGATIVDVGSATGMTAALWCRNTAAARIVCVDPWKPEPWMEGFSKAHGPVTKETFLANVPDPRIEMIQGYSPQCAAGWADPIDLYWEDGDHLNPGCRDSVRFWSQFVKGGGIACGHDYHLADVRAEVTALAERWAAKVDRTGTVWSVRRPTD